MLPKGFLIGNLTADPVCGTASDSQNNYARISVACQENYSRADGVPRVHYFNCVAWGKTAQIIQRFLKKGNKVFIEYTLSTNSYTTQDGRNIKSVDLAIQNIEFLSSPNASRDRNAPPAQPQQQSPTQRSYSPQQPQQPASPTANEKIEPSGAPKQEANLSENIYVDDIFEDNEDGISIGDIYK